MSGAVEGVALLPCPFCGRQPNSREGYDYDETPVQRFWITCSDRSHSIQVDYPQSERDVAITAWNTRTTPPARSYADEDAETQWEVWEDDLMVASSTDEADARHYLAVYSQDGPVRLVKSVTVRTPCDPAPVLSPGGKA